MAMWNPWRGCKKCSDGCLHCYIHKGDFKRNVNTNELVKTKDFEEAQKTMERYKVGMIDFEASKVFNRIRCDYFKPEDEKMIKLAIRVLVKHKRDEGRLEVLKNIDTSKVALSLERCKNDIRNNEYVINKLIKYIESKIEYEGCWN